MMSSDVPAIEQRILAIARDHFDWIGDPGPDADLRHDLDLDSLHLVELQVAVEDHFDVAFDPFDEQLVDAFQTVRHLAIYISFLVDKEKPC